jgi:hypothetical protein
MLFTLSTLIAGGYGLFWLTGHNPQLKAKMEELLDYRYLHTLEVRYAAPHIIEAHQSELLKGRGARLLEPELKFYPHLLLEVKYSQREATKEGVALWDLTDGEMVLSTDKWEKSHGFGDCLSASAASHEFRVINHLSKKGTSDTATIASILGIESGLAEVWLRGCVQKNLIIRTEEGYRLHIQNPHLPKAPESKIHERLVTKTQKGVLKVPTRFSAAKVQRLARSAFGEAFSIRKATLIYLPVYAIPVQAADGAVSTRHFNAFSGSEMPPALFYE